MYYLENFRKRNTISISLVEFFWGFGLTVLVESTFLQLFLRHYQASFFVIGLIPLMFNLIIPLMSILSAYITSSIERKKELVVIVHILAALPVLTFGIILFFSSIEKLIIPVFLFFYALFSCGIGLTLPIWQNYLVKIFKEKDTIKALSIMNITQSLTKLISSVVIFKTIEFFSISRESVSVIFILAGIVTFVGSFFFLVSVESSDKLEIFKNETLKVNDFFNLFQQSLKNRNFIYFILNDVGFFAVINVISFYAVYAEEICQINPAVVSGIFISVGVCGGIFVQFIIGYSNFFALKHKYIVEKILSLVGILCLMVWPNILGFLIASFVLGASRSIRSLCLPFTIKKIFNDKDATPYFAFVSFLILPVSVGLPILTGKFLDVFSYLENLSYQVVFISMGLLVLISLFFVLKINFYE